MGFIRAYARIAIGLALMEAVYGVLGLTRQSAAEAAGMVVTMLRVLWVVVSFLAIVVFPVYGAPIWSPLVYIALDVASLIITLIVVGTAGDHTSFFGAAHSTRAPIYEATLAAAAIYLGITAPLLWFKRAAEGSADAGTLGVTEARGTEGAPPVPTEPDSEPPEQAWTI